MGPRHEPLDAPVEGGGATAKSPNSESPQAATPLPASKARQAREAKDKARALPRPSSTDEGAATIDLAQALADEPSWPAQATCERAPHVRIGGSPTSVGIGPRPPPVMAPESGPATPLVYSSSSYPSPAPSSSSAIAGSHTVEVAYDFGMSHGPYGLTLHEAMPDDKLPTGSTASRWARLLVSRIIPGSLASSLGVKLGSELLAVNGRSVSGASMEGVTSRLTAAQKVIEEAARPLILTLAVPESGAQGGEDNEDKSSDDAPNLRWATGGAGRGPSTPFPPIAIVSPSSASSFASTSAGTSVPISVASTPVPGTAAAAAAAAAMVLSPPTDAQLYPFSTPYDAWQRATGSRPSQSPSPPPHQLSQLQSAAAKCIPSATAGVAESAARGCASAEAAAHVTVGAMSAAATAAATAAMQAPTNAVDWVEAWRRPLETAFEHSERAVIGLCGALVACAAGTAGAVTSCATSTAEAAVSCSLGTGELAGRFSAGTARCMSESQLCQGTGRCLVDCVQGSSGFDCFADARARSSQPPPVSPLPQPSIPPDAPLPPPPTETCVQQEPLSEIKVQLHADIGGGRVGRKRADGLMEWVSDGARWATGGGGSYERTLDGIRVLEFDFGPRFNPEDPWLWRESYAGMLLSDDSASRSARASDPATHGTHVTVLVHAVQPGSPADRLGLSAGSELRFLNDMPISGLPKATVLKMLAAAARPTRLGVIPPHWDTEDAEGSGEKHAAEGGLAGCLAGWAGRFLQRQAPQQPHLVSVRISAVNTKARQAGAALVQIRLAPAISGESANTLKGPSPPAASPPAFAVGQLKKQPATSVDAMTSAMSMPLLTNPFGMLAASLGTIGAAGNTEAGSGDRAGAKGRDKEKGGNGDGGPRLKMPKLDGGGAAVPRITIPTRPPHQVASSSRGQRGESLASLTVTAPPRAISARLQRTSRDTPLTHSARSRLSRGALWIDTLKLQHATPRQRSARPDGLDEYRCAPISEGTPRDTATGTPLPPSSLIEYFAQRETQRIEGYPLEIWQVTAGAASEAALRYNRKGRQERDLSSFSA